MHRIVFVLLIILPILGCSDKGVEPTTPILFPTLPIQLPTLIIAKVHWGDQGIPNIPIVLIQTGDTVRTDSSGLAVFSVSPGKYVIRALGIQRGGPSLRSVDFDVEARKGETSLVDIIDCLPCV